MIGWSGGFPSACNVKILIWVTGGNGKSSGLGSFIERKMKSHTRPYFRNLHQDRLTSAIPRRAPKSGCQNVPKSAKKYQKVSTAVDRMKNEVFLVKFWSSFLLGRMAADLRAQWSCGVRTVMPLSDDNWNKQGLGFFAPL